MPKTSRQSKASPIKERLAFLEEAYRHTLDSLEMAATLGIPEGVKPLATVTQVLSETTHRLKKLLKFRALAFFLLREPSGDLYLARCHPPAKTALMEEQMRLLVESGSAAWALQRKRAVFTTPSGMKGQLLLHSLTTASRIRGVFLGWTDQNIRTITDSSLTLLTIVLRGSASLLEGLELYGLLRQTNSELKAKVRDLEKSQRTLTNEIGRRRKVEEELKHQALHDPLTGLPNRTLMLDRIQQAIHRSRRRSDICYAVAFMDLDKFKQVNDTLGHDTGDKLLTRVGKRILESVRQMDTVARFGGDEFVIFLEELSGPAEAVRVMKRVRQTLAKPFDIDGHSVTVTGSFGLVFGPVRLISPDNLVKMANTAMHTAKEAGRNQIKVFNAKMSGRARKQATLRTGLRRAVENGGTGVLFLPTFSFMDSRLSGFEAVPTWRSKQWGQLRGDELLELADKEGVAWPLWIVTLEMALESLRSWRKETSAFKKLSVSMKLRFSRLLPADIAQSVLNLLERTRVMGGVLRLEIPEDTLIAGGEALASQLSKLKARGVHLSIGNFGERFFTIQGGTTSLFESVTIDPSKLTHQPPQKSKELLNSLMSIAKTLDLSVVAEGVDNEETAGILASLECLGIQGSSISQPLTAEQTLTFIKCFGTRENAVRNTK
ncbi:MAG: diguanylate cyclase [Desulfovibrio sp.]|nr:diguanylate cyclase [Desulfovibrio sp.]